MFSSCLTLFSAVLITICYIHYDYNVDVHMAKSIFHT